MKLPITTLVSFTLALVGLVVSQGFASHCIYQGANLTDHFLGMYCRDNNWAIFGMKFTWLDINQCLINNGGNLVPYDNGNYSTSCRDCGFGAKSNVTFELKCNCFDTQSNLKPTGYDINRILWNNDGHLGCYNHAGNTSERGPL